MALAVGALLGRKWNCELWVWVWCCCLMPRGELLRCWLDCRNRFSEVFRSVRTLRTPLGEDVAALLDMLMRLAASMFRLFAFVVKRTTTTMTMTQSGHAQCNTNS